MSRAVVVVIRLLRHAIINTGAKEGNRLISMPGCASIRTVEYIRHSYYIIPLSTSRYKFIYYWHIRDITSPACPGNKRKNLQKGNGGWNAYKVLYLPRVILFGDSKHRAKHLDSGVVKYKYSKPRQHQYNLKIPDPIFTKYSVHHRRYTLRSP